MKLARRRGITSQHCSSQSQRIASEMTDLSGFNVNLFKNIDQLMREDERRVRSGFDKAAAIVNGLFCDLASIDVRFEFDPLSLDDCRCEKVAVNEFNLMCSLKQLPYEEMELEGDAWTGAVRVRLTDTYKDSYDKVCWEDVCTVMSSGKRYLDTNKVMTSLRQAIKTVLVCERQEGASVVCQSRTGYITLVVNLHLAGVYKVNLLPAIWMSRKCRSLKYFDDKIARVFDVLDDTDTIECIQIVAKPTPVFSDTLWRITFNDLENRLVNLGKYSCFRHCIFAVCLLQKKCLVSNGLPVLSFYNIRMIALRELVKTPGTKDWEVETFSERLDCLLKSVKASLGQKTNSNLFTNVNVLENCRKKDVKVLCREFGLIRKFHKEILLRNCNVHVQLFGADRKS